MKRNFSTHEKITNLRENYQLRKILPTLVKIPNASENSGLERNF